MAIWIKNPLGVLVEDEVDAGGGLVVDGGLITELVPTGRKPESLCKHQVDADQHLVVPGLINTHHQYYRTLAHLVDPGCETAPSDYVAPSDAIWARLRPRDLRLAAKMAMARLLLSGCTTSVDHHDMFTKRLKNAIDLEIEVAEELGMRVILCRGAINIAEQDGGWLPDDLVQDDWTILTDCERLVKKHNRLGDRSGAMIEVALGPSSPFLVNNELMCALAVMARHLDCRLHTTLDGTHGENTRCWSRFEMSPLDVLENQGWLGDRTWLAHGGRLDDDEIQRLAGAGTAITPLLTMDEGQDLGGNRIWDLHAAGIPLGFAVHGSATGSTFDLMQSVRLAAVRQGQCQETTPLAAKDLLRLATEGAARCLARHDLGRIGVGQQADLALFKLDEKSLAEHGDPITALVLCPRQRADLVMVAGRWLVAEGRLVDVDLPRLLEEQRTALRYLQNGRL